MRTDFSVSGRDMSTDARKLEKAVTVSGVCSGFLEESSGKVPGKLLEMLQILGFRAPERQTRQEPWGDPAWTLSQPSVRGVF